MARSIRSNLKKVNLEKYSAELFNIRKEAFEINMRIAEMNRRMQRMHDGIKELAHRFMIVSEDLKEMKERKENELSMKRAVNTVRCKIYDLKTVFAESPSVQFFGKFLAGPFVTKVYYQQTAGFIPAFLFA